MYSSYKIQVWRLVIRRYVHKRDVGIVNNLSNYYHKDLETEICDIDKLLQIFEKRKRQPPLNLPAIKELYFLYKRQKVYKDILQKAVDEDSDLEITIQENRNPVEDKVKEKLKNYFISREHERFDRQFQRIKTFVLNLCWSMPNHLHPATPTDNEDRIIFSKVSNSISGSDHIEVGKRLGIIQYIDVYRYYLINDAALFELALQNYVSDLMGKKDFRAFRNPDTCHEFILKGIYASDIEKESLELLNDQYRLVGGASLPPFIAYMVGGSAHIKFMPERFFSCGRRYIPSDTSNQNGLYSVAQRTNVHAFIASPSEDHMKTEFDDLISFLISLYESLGLDFRVCYKKSSALNLGETLCASIQLYSVSKKEFIDAAHLSVYDDYISSRLRVLCHDKDRQHYYTWILEGVVVSVPIILAHLLERSSDKLLVPSCLSSYLYK